MSDVLLASPAVEAKKAKAVVELHRITNEGIQWLKENGYAAKKQTRAVLDGLVEKGMAFLKRREVTHNLILNNGLTYIRDSVRLSMGAAGVPANVVNGMALGTNAVAAAGTQTGLQTAIANSYNDFQTDPPSAGGNANQIDFVTFWGASDPASGPHNIEEVVICPSQATAATQAISRITSGLSLTKQDQDTLTITITWTIGTLA